MVVCKCRKVTKLYCFNHKVPVCGECICFWEHQICVVRTYSEWVIDGDYDWPPKCCHCQAELAERAADPQTTRLGCLHVIHTKCLVSYVKSFDPQTAPAGYVCPACPNPIWPPKIVKDSGSRLHSKLKEAIMQNVFGNDAVNLGVESRCPPAFASEPLHASATGVNVASTARPPNLDTSEIDGHGSGMSSLSNHEPGTTTRKSTMQVDRHNSEVPYYTDDEDVHRKKYSRRGTFRHKLLRSLLPFWSSSLPILPVTAPPRKDVSHGDDASERPAIRHPRPSRMDARKLLLILAIL